MNKEIEQEVLQLDMIIQKRKKAVYIKNLKISMNIINRRD